MIHKLPPVRIAEVPIDDSDCEYWSVEDDLTVKMVLKNEEQCPICKQGKSVFVFPTRAGVRCRDCDEKVSRE